MLGHWYENVTTTCPKKTRAALLIWRKPRDFKALARKVIVLGEVE